MKRATAAFALFFLLLTACGLKVDATIVAGDDGLGPGTVEVDEEGNPLDEGALDDVVAPGKNDRPGDDGDTPLDGGPLDSIFNSETEGITKDRITLCSHVPITGASPINHHENRFGQFYFDFVNAELGGVFGRKVTFKSIDDRYFPAGARDAMEQCYRLGSFIYFGAAGTDQIVSVAKWAETKKVPYLHGPTSVADMAGLNYNVAVGPGYEYQHRLLARYLVERYGKDKKYGSVRVDSRYFEAGVAAFKDELEKLGAEHVIELKVQKDEKQFYNTYYELEDAGVEILNNFTTPLIWINMSTQAPPTYNPVWTAVSPVAGYNIVSTGLPRSLDAVIFHSFSPACECTTYVDTGAPGTVTPPKSLPWYSDIQEFLRIFRKYSPEQDPPPDDFDYASYLAAKGIHRLLLELGPQPTRTKLWDLFDSYKETVKQTFPGCPGDFTRSDDRIGAWRVNILELDTSKASPVWNHVESCVDSV